MALATNALTNVATLESILGLASGSADAQLQRIINQASAIAEAYAGRVFYRDTAISEKYTGKQGPILCVARPPLNSITSVTYLSGSADDSSSYEIADEKVGEIFRISGTWAGLDWSFGDTSVTAYRGAGRRVWTIVYDGGWYTPKQDDEDGAVTRNLPEDIEHAVIQICVALYRSEGRDPTLASESLMSASQSFKGAGGHWLETNVSAAADILKRYRLGLIG